MIMRIASDAETAAQPAPHMDPPPLLNNQGERGQFVLTAGNPDASGKAAAFRVLTQDVVLSKPMAKQEIDRYTFRSPGQAGSYF